MNTRFCMYSGSMMMPLAAIPIESNTSEKTTYRRPNFEISSEKSMPHAVTWSRAAIARCASILLMAAIRSLPAIRIFAARAAVLRERLAQDVHQSLSVEGRQLGVDLSLPACSPHALGQRNVLLLKVVIHLHALPEKELLLHPQARMS